ncbi:MAG: hypothetical protein K9J74_00765 [Sulfuritalea sp.]|nr:hypothetical protein [Sulfuritalea sp.]
MNTTIRRLAGPLAISLALHLGIGGLFSPYTPEYAPKRATTVTLRTTLPAVDHSSNIPAVAPDKDLPATIASAKSPDAEGSLTRKARFIVAPNLAELETIPVPFGGKLALRLHVSALGRVDRVTVINGDPVPRELLDGLVVRLQHAQLIPAMAGSVAVASTLDLVISIEPAPVPLLRDP